MSMVSESLAATAAHAIDHAALAETMPLEKIDVSDPSLYEQDVWQPYFRRSSPPDNLANFEGLIRGRVRSVLDGLPRGETFNWVDKVSIELTGQMLATLFDFPFEDRRKLSYWSDVSTAVPYQGGLVESEEQREAVFRECLGYFMNLWNERVNAEPRPDLISMLAHGEATRHMSAREYFGNVILLIVGGNDTTRNSMSAGLLFLC
jgi:cytochrome P450